MEAVTNRNAKKLQNVQRNLVFPSKTICILQKIYEIDISNYNLQICVYIFISYNKVPHKAPYDTQNHVGNC